MSGYTHHQENFYPQKSKHSIGNERLVSNVMVAILKNYTLVFYFIIKYSSLKKKFKVFI